MAEKEWRKEKKRLPRSDRKVACAPYILDKHRVWIHRLARRLDISEGEVGTRLLVEALNAESCLAFFRDYFKRSYQDGPNHTIYPTFKPKNIYDLLHLDTKDQQRFKFNLTQALAERITDFQIALGISFFAHTVKALLEYALQEAPIVEAVAPGIELSDYRKTLPSGHLNTNPTVWSIFK